MEKEQVDIAGSQRGDKDQKKETQVYTCKQHAGYALKIFCYEHQTVCCVRCVRENHKECTSFDTMNNIGSRVVENGTVNALLDRFNELRSIIETIMKKSSDNIESMQYQNQELIKNVKRVIQKLVGKLETMAECFEEDIAQLVGKETKNIEENMKELQTLQEQLQTTCEKLNDVQNNGSYCDISYEVIQLKADAEKYQNCISDARLNDGYRNVDLDCDLETLQSIYKSLSPLKVTRKETLFPSNIQNMLESVKELSESEYKEQRMDLCKDTDIDKIEAIRQPVVHVLSRDEITGTWITGGALMSNGTMVLCDFNNQKLKGICTSGDVVFDHSFKSCPWDMGVTESEEILICFTNEIAKFQLSDEIRQTGSIDVYGVHGVNVLNGRILAMTSHKILILSDDGNLIKSIKRESSDFVSTIATSKLLKRFYYLDGSDSLVCRDEGGGIVWTYKSETLSSSAGIAVDLGGNVYVCCVERGQILSISRDGAKSHMIIEKFDLIKKPWKIWFNDIGDKLYVSEYGEASVVEVFHLQVKQTKLDISDLDDDF